MHITNLGEEENNNKKKKSAKWREKEVKKKKRQDFDKANSFLLLFRDKQ